LKMGQFERFPWARGPSENPAAPQLKNGKN